MGDENRHSAVRETKVPMLRLRARLEEDRQRAGSDRWDVADVLAVVGRWLADEGLSGTHPAGAEGSHG